MRNFTPQPHDVLLLVDLQNDFLPGGALGVTGANALLPTINQLSHAGFGTIVASRDWHPPHHCSFETEGGPWPAHCVAGTKGAAFSTLLDQSALTHIIHKGTNAQHECYSAFADDAGNSTGLSALLQARAIERLFICGIALDYCVKASACDALKAGFETHIIPSLCASIGPAEPVLTQLRREGVYLNQPLIDGSSIILSHTF